MTLDDAPDVLTVEEAARLLRCGRNQAYALIARGDLYAARLGGRSLRVPKRALEDFLLGRQNHNNRRPTELAVVEGGRGPGRPQTG